MSLHLWMVTPCMVSSKMLKKMSLNTKMNVHLPEGYIPILVQNGASRPIQIPVSHDNYIYLSQKYEDEGLRYLTQENKLAAHPVTDVEEPRSTISTRYWKKGSESLKGSISLELMLWICVWYLMWSYLQNSKHQNLRNTKVSVAIRTIFECLLVRWLPTQQMRRWWCTVFKTS